MILFSAGIGSNLSLLLTASIISFLTTSSLSLTVDWEIPANGKYEPLTATVGDTITFDFTSYWHNVLIYPSGNCDATDSINLGNTSPVKYTFDKTGVYTFACGVSDGAHCSAGQIIDVTITDDSSSDQNKDESENLNNEETDTEDSNESPVDEEDKDKILEKYKDYFNPGEEMGLVEFRIKPYTIPRETTTYVDFVFNLPDDIPDIVHIVIGDVINSQPKHLHHLVLNGCTESIDPSQEGLPLDDLPRSCYIPLGAWAIGGGLYDSMSMDSGMIFGSGLGIKAYSLNVHYTDGQAVDPNRANDGTHAIATDGVRIMYTPNLRPKTSLFKPVITIGTGPPAMNLPPNVPRYFYTKTCTVEPSCQDTSAEVMEKYGLDFTCETHKHYCLLATGFQLKMVQTLCPVTCGFCGNSDDSINSSIKNNNNEKGIQSIEYHVNAVTYHAHLIGREMYTTLLPKSTGTPIDLESKNMWIFDYQITYPVHDKQDDKPYFKVHPGDKIQATCVYDTTSRQETTQFDLSTYDEMCITRVHLLVDTPQVTVSNGPSLLKMLSLKSFTCAIDESSDIWGGVLEADEDGRDIWKDHPMTEADCTFPVGIASGFGLSDRGDAFPNQQIQCTGDNGSNNKSIKICNNFDDTVFDNDALAGEYCEGGKVDGASSHMPSSYSEFGSGTFREICTTNGGVYMPYTCEFLNAFLNGPAAGTRYTQEEMDYMLNNWWGPKCCFVEDIGSSSEDTGVESTSGTFTKSFSRLFFYSLVACLMVAF